MVCWKDIAKILEYVTTAQAIRVHVELEDKIKVQDLRDTLDKQTAEFLTVISSIVWIW